MHLTFEIFKTANRALLLHKGRTVLTMLGVIIGVFAVVTLVSMGIGFQNYIEDQFESIGSNVVAVAPGKVDFTGDPARMFGNNKLAEKHVDIIKTYAGEYVEAISPTVRFGKTVIYKTKSYYTTILGSAEDAKNIISLEIDKGRYFTSTEVDNKVNVAIIGYTIDKKLFSNMDALDKKIKLENRIYTVIGTTKKKGQDFDENVYIPYTRAMDDFQIRNISSIAISIKSGQDVNLAMKQIEYALLRDLKNDEFTVISADDILQSIQNVLKILTAGIGAIAGISLLVGGIGIMNIMLVSVTERIREIGLRKALGATPQNISVQFLLESILISVGGGGIGLLLGWLASLAARAYVRTEVPLWTVFLAFGFSVFVGIVFGTYPAIKAGKKDPIEALRYE